MDDISNLRDKHRARREILDQRRTYAKTRRTLTAARPTGTQERLEGIFRAAPIGMGLLCQRVFIEFNDRFCEMVGYSRDELIGRSSRILYVTQEDYDHVGTVEYEQIARTGTGTVETRWKCKDGDIIDILLSSSVLDRTDPSQGVAFTATDITVTRKIQARLCENEFLLREAEAISHVGSVQRDLRTGVITWSDETYRIYGYAPGEVCPSAELILSHIHPEDRERFLSVTGMPDQAGRLEELTYRVIRKDGQVRTLHARASLERDSSGKPTRLVGAVQDITQRTVAEQALREGEGKYRLLVEHSPDAICIQSEDIIRFANRAALRLLGAARYDQVVGRHGLDFVHPDYRRLAEARMTTLREESVAVPRREMKYVRVDGQVVEVEVVGVPISFQGKPAAQFIVHDITERKQVERSLAESEERFKVLADESFDSIIIHDGDKMISVNQTFCRTWGYEPQEVPGSEVARYVTPESLALIREHTRSGYDKIYEITAVRKDGTTFPAEVASKLFVYKDRTVRVATVRDVSATRQAEEARRASEARFRGVFQHAPLGITIGINGVALAVNPAFAQIVGYDAEELVGRHFHDYTHPDDRAHELEFVQDVLSGRREGATLRKRFLHKDGRTIWADVTMTTMRDRFGQVESMIGIVEDITERRQAEQRLDIQHSLSIDLSSIRELEPALNRLFEAVRNLGEIDCCGLYLVDPVTGALNMALHQGLSADFIKRVSHYAADAPNALVTKAGKPVYGLYSSIRPPEEGDLDHEGFRGMGALPIMHQGQVIAVLNVSSYTRDELSAEVKTTLEIIAAEVSGTIARLRAEQALRESEAQFRAIAAVSPAAIAIMSEDEQHGRFLYVNAAWEAQTGYSRDEAATLEPSTLAHPDLRAEMTRQALAYTRGENTSSQRELKILTRHGETRYIDLAATAIQYEGAPAFLTVALDITARKVAEEALATASRQWQSTFDSVSDVIWVLDNEFRICRCNKATELLFHRTAQEIVGKHCWEIVHDTIQPTPLCPLHQLRQTLTRQIIELCLDGRWYEVTVDPILDAAGKLDGIVHIISDITKHKRTEEYLLTQRKKLRSLASELSLAEERERRRIAANLHDHACQSLALAKMQLQATLDTARPAKAALRPICTHLEETIDSIRELTFDLSSATLYKFGLEAALRELLNDEFPGLENVPRQFLTDGKPKPLSPDVRVLLYQSVRELLINVAKHARATRVTVEVRRESERIRIRVADDGVGFDVETVLSSAYRNRSVGLFFVRERLDYIGGTLEVDARPGRGSQFTLTAPLEKEHSVLKESDDAREDPVG